MWKWSMLGESHVLVAYENQRYPGLVTEVNKEANEHLVNVLHQCRGGWYWLLRRDEIWYNDFHVIKKLNDPVPVNNRDVFCFEHVNDI
jgi:hypothetical protein